ncbi:MAG: site-specific integrase [Bryobacterales bacterium]|nr:site-specific integrase [Bryobacterales bacterium]
MIYKRGKFWHMDVTVNGVRYREALDSTDRREALALEKQRVADIQQGKGSSTMGRDFARKPFTSAADEFQAERRPHVSTRTDQFERERLKPLRRHFGEKLVMRISAADVAAYQRARLAESVSGRTINMEVGVLRRILRRAKRWTAIAEDVRMFPERGKPIAKVLSPEDKQRLFATAATNPDWMVSYCAGVLSASTTCRGVELKNLRWCDVDLFQRVLSVTRSKTEAGHRSIPVNADAMAAFLRLRERAEMFGSVEPEHYVFPACEHNRIDPTRPQKSFRTAWRKLTRAAGLPGFRLHDLRHQAVTELAEAGASDATLMAIAGHMSRRMLEHYSHVRLAAKREVLDRLECGLMDQKGASASAPASEAIQ